MFNQDDKPIPAPKTPSISGSPMGSASATDISPPSSLGSVVSPSPSIATPSITTPQRSITPVSGGDDGLLAIKQQALAQLSPLVDKLDQTPEEKFRLTMTMIQASDDHSLIETAYEAAQKITDEKIRAESLLSIVNEVNYFSQKATKPGEPDTAL